MEIVFIAVAILILILGFLAFHKSAIVIGRILTAGTQDLEIKKQIKLQKKRRKQLNKLSQLEVITNDQLRDILERVDG